MILFTPGLSACQVGLALMQGNPFIAKRPPGTGKAATDSGRGRILMSTPRCRSASQRVCILSPGYLGILDVLAIEESRSGVGCAKLAIFGPPETYRTPFAR